MENAHGIVDKLDEWSHLNTPYREPPGKETMSLALQKAPSCPLLVIFSHFKGYYHPEFWHQGWGLDGRYFCVCLSLLYPELMVGMK